MRSKFSDLARNQKKLLSANLHWDNDYVLITSQNFLSDYQYDITVLQDWAAPVITHPLR